MIDDILIRGSTNIPNWILAVLILGSVVDIAQFFWIVRRNWRRVRLRYRNHLKRQLLFEIHARDKKL